MRRLVETYETLGGDVWRRMRRLVKRIRIHMCDWKNKSPGDLFFPEVEKQVSWGLVFSRSGKTSPQGTCFWQFWKNKSPGDLFFPGLEKQDFT